MTIESQTSEKNDGGSKTLSVWDFISLVSHQLRNPLASSRLSLDLLLQKELGPLTDQQQEYLEMIFNDNQKMISLVKEFLTISQIERGEIKLNTTENTNLTQLILQTIKELRPFAAAHNVVVFFKDSKKPITINCDRIKTKEVIQNLMDNAIKYNTGGSRVEIELEYDESKGHVKFTCRDTGIGIPKKSQPEIFSKFYRAENAGRIDPEGTGIGLYLAKAVVEKSGGKIGFKSEEGKGSTFWFTLPLSREKKS